MNQQIWSGLVAALFASTVGVASSSRASQDQTIDPAQVKVGSGTSLDTRPQPDNVVKMGERQSQTAAQIDEVEIAKIQSHTQAGRNAVTLYVRDIPILTFLGSQQLAATGVKVATTNLSERLLGQASPKATTVENPQDPVWRGTTVAAKLNQLSRENFDAKSIQVGWNAKRKHYAVQAGKEQLVELNAQTVPPSKTSDQAVAALQITNLLRRQLGDAPPLRAVPDKPVAVPDKPVQTLRRSRPGGIASWYGPGFHGRRTASGEHFNQYALTAAHRSLPFGTRVRVTNTYNGRSVVVRINDRGPFTRGRIIDLSRKAAQVLGVFSRGSAPVRLDVLK